MIFMHIAVPLFVLFVMWLHLQRVIAAADQPAARRWRAGVGLSLLALVA